MELLLIIFIWYMYFITKGYNTKNSFNNWLVNALVQLLHIIILVFILITMFKFDNKFYLYLHIPLLIYTLLKNILWFFQNFIYFEYYDEDNKNNEVNDNNDDNDNNNEKER